MRSLKLNARRNCDLIIDMNWIPTRCLRIANASDGRERETCSGRPAWSMKLKQCPECIRPIMLTCFVRRRQMPIGRQLLLKFPHLPKRASLCEPSARSHLTVNSGKIGCKMILRYTEVRESVPADRNRFSIDSDWSSLTHNRASVGFF